MPPVTVTLYEYGSVTLDVNGNGTVKIGPISARETWHPANAHVSANPNATNEAQCSIFVGYDTSPQYYIDGTFSGSAGDTTDAISSATVQCGSYVFAVWTGGDPGVIATLSLTGSKDV